VEYMLKGVYETSIGRFTRWTAGGEDTREDQIITAANRAYSNLIFDQAWYEFDFSAWRARIWEDTDFFGENFIRKFERKLFFSLEYGFKSFYAKLIKFGAQTAYEQSDGLIYLAAGIPPLSKGALPDPVQVIGSTDEELLLSIPRWGEFTKAVTELAHYDLEYRDISGNQLIVMSLLSEPTNDKTLVASQTIFSTQLVSNQSRQRTYSLVQVSRLSEAINEAISNGFQVEHVFDY
jgi:hypothetical protein